MSEKSVMPKGSCCRPTNSDTRENVDTGMTTDVFLSALEMALGRRGQVTGLTHHSDRGSQYCSVSFQKALEGAESRRY